MDDVLNMAAAEQAAAIAGGDLSAAALMAATLDRVAAVNGPLNAIVSMRDRDALMAEARAADARGASGALHGLPVAVKDLADVAGLPTSQGSPAFAGQVARADSLHVARMRAAGCIFIGKTNTPEFGLGSHTYNPVHGTTRNPYDPGRTCGGSSGGAAVALATRMVGIADGSDMMGSLRNPAGWNNVYGFRPSWGLVPSAPEGDTFLHQLSTNGPMARSPADLALLLDVMAGPDRRLPNARNDPPVGAVQADAKGARIGWLGDWGGAWPFEDGILALCEAALKVFAGQGATVEPVAPPFSREALWDAWVTLRAWSNAASLAPLYEDPATHNQLKPEAVWEIEQGRKLTALEVHAASVLRSEWYVRAAELFETYDALVTPTAQVWPFPVDWDWPKEIAGVAMDTYHRWMEVVLPVSLIGLPSVAVPAGFGAQGLPMGMQLFGPRGADGALLRLAQAYHEATDWPGRRPPPVG